MQRNFYLKRKKKSKLVELCLKAKENFQSQYLMNKKYLKNCNQSKLRGDFKNKPNTV